MPARLLECRIRGDAGAGVGRGEVLRHAIMWKKVASVRHDNVRTIAAGSTSAERAWVQTEQFLALTAHRAFPAANPWVRHDLIAYLDACGLRSERYYLPRDFMSHREWQVHAARFQRDPPLLA